MTSEAAGEAGDFIAGLLVAPTAARHVSDTGLKRDVDGTRKAIEPVAQYSESHLVSANEQGVATLDVTHEQTTPQARRGAVSRRTTDLDTKIAALLFAAFAVLYVSTVTKGQNGYNGASRFALVQAIVEQHTFSIDRTLYASLTKDKAFVHGHYYSDKAPGQALIAVPLYWILYHLGVSFEKHRNLAEIFLKVPFALLAAFVPMLFFIVSRPYAPALKARLLVSLVVGAGTGVFVLAGVFFSHSAVAGLLMMSFYFSQRAREENTSWLWLSGAASGFAFLLEYPAILLVIAIHLNYLSQQWRTDIGKAILGVGKAALAVLPFAACILFLNLRITGHVLDFPYYHTGDWPGSPLQADTNKFEFRQITLQRAAQMLFFGKLSPQGLESYRGLFLYSPFLLAGLFFLRKEHVILLLGCLAVVVLYTGSVTLDAVGGCTFSNRYLIITVPFLALPALQLAQHWPRVFSVTAGASIIMNFIGATVPLSCARFTLGEGLTQVPALVRNGVAFSSLMIVLFVLFPSIARKGDAVVREISAGI